MQLFARLTKIDEATRRVWGRATQEVPDRAGEIFDYASSKPHFVAWSEGISKATDGKSLGNVRAMHGKVAAGKLNEITFNDAEKAIDIVAEIVDDQEWKKCVSGVYTGLSIGGSYVRKWDDEADKTLKRYEAQPAEISIVDLPCVPVAQFTMVKADGASVDVPFVTKDEITEGNKILGAIRDALQKSDAADEGKPPVSTDLPQATDPAAASDPEKAAVDQLAKHLDAGAVKPSTLVEYIEKMLAESAEFTKATDLAALRIAVADESITNAQVEALAEKHLTADERGAIQGEGGVRVLGLLAELQKRAFSAKERKKEAESGDAMKDGSFPIKDKSDLSNAIKAVGRAKNPAAAKRHIKTRAKELGAEDMLPEAWKAGGFDEHAETALAKGMYGVAQLAYAIAAIEDCLVCAEFETAQEGDASPIPARLGMVCDELGLILCEMADEETREMADKAIVADLKKAGARHSKADKDRLQAIHDHSIGMGAECGTEKAVRASMAKALGMAEGADPTAMVAELRKKAKLWDDAPAVPKGSLRAIAKHNDVPVLDEDNPEHARDVEIQSAVEKAQASGNPQDLVKLIHRHGAIRT